MRLGVDGAEGHNWLAEPLSFFVVAVVIIVWMSVPFVALSIYAGLTQVSTEVLEAAELDGANGIQRLRHIILPLIAPVLSIVMLLQLIWDLRVFTQIKLLQDAGGVANETNLLGTYVYQLGTGKGDFGTASAVSILILGLTIALSCVLRPLAHEGGRVMRRSRAKRTLLTALALVLAVAWAFPVYWMLNSAFLPNVVLQSATPDVPAVRRLARQPARGRDRPGVRPGADHLARRHAHDRRRRAHDRLPRRAGDQPLPVPRPGLVRARPAADPDAARPRGCSSPSTR